MFSQEVIAELENRIIERIDKKGKTYPVVSCLVRNKEIKLTPEEIVRQLYAAKLINDYGYPKSRLAFEYPIYFGRETKRADIVRNKACCEILIAKLFIKKVVLDHAIFIRGACRIQTHLKIFVIHFNLMKGKFQIRKYTDTSLFFSGIFNFYIPDLHTDVRC